MQVHRYSAKLLFQFRVETPDGAGRIRICEERIITFEARGAREALKKAKAKGRAAQYDYKNDDDNPVYFDFIGIKDMIQLDPVCEDGEIWYDIKRYLLPMERKDKLIPSDDALLKRV